MVSDLLGKVELPVRVLNSFQASSVSLVRRELWMEVSSEAISLRVRVLGGGVGRLVREEGGGLLLRAKIDGGRKE